ncbi:hypothetical protein MBAV_004394 [Candidatus Magnetobacterium bavaricum]|uniref:Uncharacterized protein n=1 Tax=Candidatus Magnetobacterium bavaricum TaxID=29290 RepID=A0A0F3GNF2_9BACT|nr:hypothetical protein MBAV_004394 [Candidatus Magnetobacterium bavaricum]
MCSLITTGRLRPTLAIRPARGSSSWAMATSPPTISPSTTTYGRCVADRLVIWLIWSFRSPVQAPAQ